jgi:hypothetical protein
MSSSPTAIDEYLNYQIEAEKNTVRIQLFSIKMVHFTRSMESTMILKK